MQHSEQLDTPAQLEELMGEKGGSAVIDFWSPTCGPCKAMAPAFEAVAAELSEESIRFVRINTATRSQLAEPFNIHAVPTILFVHNGEILDVRVGALSGPALAKKARWLIKKASGQGLLSRIFG